MARVLVVGAGLSGLSVAMEASVRGHHVVVLLLPSIVERRAIRVTELERGLGGEAAAQHVADEVADAPELVIGLRAALVGLGMQDQSSWRIGRVSGHVATFDPPLGAVDNHLRHVFSVRLVIL